MPTSYFSLEGEGFYCHLICKVVFGTTSIKISTANTINLNFDEKISYDSKEKQKNFKIKLFNQYFMIESNRKTYIKVERHNNEGENDVNFKKRRISVFSQRKVYFN